MIDIENKIIDTLDAALPGVTVYSTFELVPEEFPCVMVDYDYAGDLVKTFDNQLSPHHASISVQVDSFALSKNEAKQINASVVDTMHNMKFTCTESFFFGTYAEGIHRCTARFTAIVGEGETDEETTTYRMYRR